MRVTRRQSGVAQWSPVERHEPRRWPLTVLGSLILCSWAAVASIVAAIWWVVR